MGSDEKSATVDSRLSTHTGRYAVQGSDLEITPKKHLSTLSRNERVRQVQVTRQVFLVFDGWTEGTEHFIGITASYMPKRADQVVTHTLLSMRPLLADEIKGMTACDHLHHLSKVMRQYGKTEANVVYLVGDNCNVNQCMSRLLKVPLLGCGSHKFNLAVRKWISNQPQLEKRISKVATVMKKASTLKVSAQLRKLTSLQPYEGK